jgi:hypothetical protein
VLTVRSGPANRAASFEPSRFSAPRGFRSQPDPGDLNVAQPSLLRGIHRTHVIRVMVRSIVPLHTRESAPGR